MLVNVAQVVTYGLACIAVGTIGGIPLGYWIASWPVPPLEQPSPEPAASARTARQRRPARPGGEEADPR